MSLSYETRSHPVLQKANKTIPESFHCGEFTGTEVLYPQFTHKRADMERSLYGRHDETIRALCDWHPQFWWVSFCPRAARLFPKWANKLQNAAEKQHCSPLMWNMSTDLLGGTNKEVWLPICWAGLYSAVSPSILHPDWWRVSGGSGSSFETLLWWLVPLLFCGSAASHRPRTRRVRVWPPHAATDAL